MTPQILEETGRALYADETWKTPLAAALGYRAMKTIQRFVNGESAIPPDMPQRLIVIIDRQISKLQKIREKLAKID